MKWPVCHILLFVLSSLSGYGQKYCFFNYQVENGLAQSQAYDFCQDSSHQLWIATYGGVSRFDGAHFTNFTRADGLINDLTTCLLRDKKNNIWIGTHAGLSRFDGKGFRNFSFPGQPSHYIAALAEDKEGSIWVVAGFRLFCIRDSTVKQVDVLSGAASPISTLSADRKGNLWVAVYKQGVFCREKDTWVKEIDFSGAPDPVECRKICFDVTAPGTCWIVHRKGLMYYDGKLPPDARSTGEKLFPGLDGKENLLPPGEFYAMETDAFAKIWILTSEGVFRLHDQGYERFSCENGFTDDAVTNMYKDQENNFWFSTIGAGIWRYSFDPFTILDKPPGGKLAAVTAFAEAGQEGNKSILIGTYGQGLLKYDGHNLSRVKIPCANAETKKILCLLRDDKGTLWIGTDNKGGLWRFADGRFERMDTKIKGLAPAINHISQDDRGGLWLSTSAGCRYLSAAGVVIPVNLNSVCTLPLGGDSVLVGTEQGLYRVRRTEEKLKTTFSLEKVLEGALGTYSIFSLLKKGDSIFIGTQSKGLVVWNNKLGTVTNLTTREGLNSNIIYALLSDRMGNLWVATGKGINKIDIGPDKNPGNHPGMLSGTQPFNVFNYAIPGTVTASETDQNAVLQDGKGNLWFGTTMGALLYDPHQVGIAGIPATVVIQHVKAFTKDLQKGVRLPYEQHPLTFEFRGISFKNAHDLLYQYKLDGLEKEYSPLTPDASVVYSALAPGRYTFLVRAFIPGVGYSPNTDSFPFSVTGPFYTSRFFPFGVLLGLILLALVLQAWSNSRREERKIKLELIRQDEQDKVRKRTLEDFHDEIGNKITRISVLTELLYKKLEDREEARKIIRQIKDNIGALYTGTREILWSLTPMSNHLQEIGKHLQGFGIELFQDTRVQFHFSAHYPGNQPVHINSEYSRNIMMIVKEAMNNILKHAEAGNVLLEINLFPDGVLTVWLEDDGKGFDPDSVKMGHGIANMHMRAGRIHGNLQLRENSHRMSGDEPDATKGSGKFMARGSRLILTTKLPFFEAMSYRL
ncbi:ligand-binding sensor domain-containing protein [Flavitalea flava]